MKYSIKKSDNSSILFTHEDGIKAYRSTPVEKEFWERIQELEHQIFIDGQENFHIIATKDIKIKELENILNDLRRQFNQTQIKLNDAEELLREIRDGEVNPQDEADKFLRDHQPSELQKLRSSLDEITNKMWEY